MICDPRCVPSHRRSTLASHLTETIQSACGPSLSLDTNALDEVANAVEFFLGAGKTAFVVDSDHLLLLASRALGSLGHGAQARRLIILGSGLVQPAEWEVSGSQAVWTVDLKRMTVVDGPNLEILFFAGLRLVLESIAEVWDACSGTGVLGLRHVCPAAAALVGSEKKQDVARFTEEIVTTSSSLLDQISRRRAWTDVPRVMNLDVR
mgnify:CR=1 FL=1